MNPPKLHVYAAHCGWSGSILDTGTLPLPPSANLPPEIKNAGIPCCPYCKSPLFQVEEEKWWKEAAIHEAKGHPNYVDFAKWKESQRKCWPTLAEAAVEYKQATGKEVVLHNTRTLADEWKIYRDRLWPKGMPAAQNKELHQAFYAGALVALENAAAGQQEHENLLKEAQEVHAHLVNLAAERN